MWGRTGRKRTGCVPGVGMTARHIGRQHGDGVSVGGEEFRGADRPGAELGQPAFPACAAR